MSSTLTYTYKESIAFLERLDSSVQKLGLERVRYILGTLENPQDALPMVHVTGTNGKGSVTAILSSVLNASGLKVGMFTSPHLVDVRERIVLNGKLISEDDFAAAFTKIKRHLEKIGLPRDEWPTYFEWINIQAYLYFQQQGADITVFEVGLGGRLDSTNVVASPNVTVITGIGMDHAHILGDTLEKIATEKAGIIKQGVPLVLGPSIHPAAEQVICDIAEKLAAPIYRADKNDLSILPASSLKEGLHVQDKARNTSYILNLRAPYQLENLATALTVVDLLKGQGFDISNRAIASGLSNVQWPARFQVLPEQRMIIDGSHNVQGFESLAEALRFYLPETPIHWLLSLQSNRALEPLIETVKNMPGTQSVTWTCAMNAQRYHSPQAAAELSKKIMPQQIEIAAYDQLPEAFSAWRHCVSQSSDAYGLASGSLYTAGDLLKLTFK